MMGLFLESNEIDLTNIPLGQLLTDLIEENGVYTSFEQFDDPTSEITKVRIFDIVTVSYQGQLYHLVRRHDGLNAGLPHIVHYVDKCFMYRKLDNAEAKLRQMISEFLKYSN